MRADLKIRFSLFSTLLAGLFLLVAIGVQYNSSQQRKLPTCDGDTIEFAIDNDAEEGSGKWELPFNLALTPGGFNYLERKAELKSPELSYTKHTKKQLSEKRLYILYHHLKSHIG